MLLFQSRDFLNKGHRKVAGAKWKDLIIAFIWAYSGFFWSRGLEIKPSGYEDEKECKRSKTADLAKTPYGQGRRFGYI